MTIPAAGAGQTSAAQTQAERARAFRALHEGPGPLLLPNPWDAGSARLLASLGFAALATTSGGFAATLGRLDGGGTRDEALGHAAAIVAGTPPAGGQGGPRAAGAHRPRRELPARPAGPGRHHPPPAGLPGGGRGCAVRT